MRWRLSLVLWCLITLSTSKISAIDDEFIIETTNLPDDLNFMPTLGNGHLGYTVFGKAIYMNGVYNGRGGSSRRARIPNWINLDVISAIDGNQKDHLLETTKVYEMNVHAGYFRWRHSETTDSGLKVEQRTYAHRFYNRALIYELSVQRTEAKAPLTLKLKQSPGGASTAINFTPLSVGDVNAYSSTKTPKEMKAAWKVLKGQTKVLEHRLFQTELKTIFVVLSEDLVNEKILEMAADQKELYYRFILTADEDETVARTEMENVLSLNASQLLESHANEWRNFWQTFNIKIYGNTELSRIVNAGIFYIASSLSSQNSFHPNKEISSLSPTGLGRGELDSDYEGHSFWDTEIWMLPVITQVSNKWGRELLEYRKSRLRAAQYNAHLTGYEGARYPWESAYTGTEVTNPCCPVVAANQIHITTDIVFALKQQYAISNDNDWLCETAWPMLREIIEFLTRRVVWNSETGKYHIRNVMGPDEDHANVTDSVYTNFSFKMAIEFTIFVQGVCAKTGSNQYWRDIANNLIILYDPILDYHPQYDGYKVGEEIKQADVILLGYPLQFEMNMTTQLNDLEKYESVTRESGPAMTWSMFAINFLDVKEVEKANLYFEKGYESYIRTEFKNWSENQRGYNGAANFLTGIGGFVQAIINGYGGIRFYNVNEKSVLEIKTRHLMPGTEAFHIHGFHFAGAVFQLSVNNSTNSNLLCLSVGAKKIVYINGIGRQEVNQGFTVDLGTETVFVQTI